MYGTQTGLSASTRPKLFENDVKMYGTQTVLVCIIMHRAFENDVKMYGTQTEKSLSSISISLRMM